MDDQDGDEFTFDWDGEEVSFIRINVSPEELEIMKSIISDLFTDDDMSDSDRVKRFRETLDTLGIDNLADRIITNLNNDQMYAVGEELVKSKYEDVLDDPLGVSDEDLNSLEIAFKTWYPQWVKSRVGEEDHALSLEMIDQYMLIIDAVRKFRNDIRTISDQMMSMTPAVFAMMDKYGYGDTA